MISSYTVKELIEKLTQLGPQAANLPVVVVHQDIGGSNEIRGINCEAIAWRHKIGALKHGAVGSEYVKLSVGSD